MSVVANVAINVDSLNAVTQLQRFENATKSAAAGVTGLVASLAAGLAFGQLIKSASQFEASLSEIGKTAGASEKEIASLAVALKELSAPSKTNLAPSILAAGVKDLVAQGLKLNDAIASMETLGKVAVATNSELTDVTKTGFQLQSALKIKPTELKETFDALAFAGKAGAFELKDMAQFMPTIASAATSIGITGKKGAVALAAMMQMVRKDAPGAAEASTRLTDALLKMTAPDAVKNFAKFGVNIEQVLKGAVAKGVNPMDAALKELQRVTGGDAFKLSQIFGDKEAKLALMSLMKYREEYEKLKAAAGGAAAAGTVQADFEASLETFNGKLQTLQTSGEILALSLGNTLLPILARLIEEILPIIDGVAKFVQGMGQVPKPVIDAAIGLGKMIIQLMLVDKALKIAMGTAALFRGAMLLLTTQTTLAGAAALTGQARLLMLAGGIKGAGVAAATATPAMLGLLTLLLRLAAIGAIAIVVNIAVTGMAALLQASAEIAKLRGERTQKGGPAANFGGSITPQQRAENEKTLAAIKKERESLGQQASAAFGIGKRFTQSRTDILLEREIATRAKLALPTRKEATPTPTPTPTPTGTGVTPAGTGKGAGKGENDAERKAEEKRRAAEELANLQGQVTLKEKLFGIDKQIAVEKERGSLVTAAALEMDKALEERQARIAEITRSTADTATKNAQIKEATLDADQKIYAVQQAIKEQEAERTKSFNEIIAGLDLELALKTATTEQAREQLRLEAEIAKLKGQGFTPEQIGAITAKKTELAAPKTDQQNITDKIGKLKDEITDLTSISNIAITSAEGIGNAFAQSFQGLISGTMTAKEALGSFFKSVADMFLEMAAQIIAKQITMIILQTILKALGAVGGGGGGGNAASALGSNPNVAAYAPLAKGGTFGNGVAAFAKGGTFSNSIVSSPTLFKFADGGTTRAGLMGEAGPEAIMPLKRGSDGSLGVQATGLREAMGRPPGGANGSTVLNMSFQSTTINGTEYVSRDQLEAAMAATRRQAASDGANRGMSMTLDKLQQSPSTRSRLGMGGR